MKFPEEESRVQDAVRSLPLPILTLPDQQFLSPILRNRVVAKHDWSPRRRAVREAAKTTI